MAWGPSSDAQQFASPDNYDDAAQIAALQLFLACGERFAEVAYRAGIRWFSWSGLDSSTEDFKLALEHFGLTSGWWLTDIWTGQDVMPRDPRLIVGSLEDRKAQFRGLRPSPDGGSGFPGQLVPVSSTVRAASRTRTELLAIHSESTRRLDYEIPTWHPHNAADLPAVVAEMTDAIRPSRLWFRGQTTQHRKERDREVMDWLGLPASDISLIPR